MAAVSIAVSCIYNDLPYPAVEAYITGLEVEDAESVDINYDSRTVTVHFSETKDVRSVAISGVTYDRADVSSSIELIGEHDLTSPLSFTIKVYRDYEWQIVAVRNIKRSFAVSGQVGSSEIDDVNHRVLASVGKKVNLSRLNVTSLKLGPEGITTYTIIDPETGEAIASGTGELLDSFTGLDFSNGVYVDVTSFDVTDRWTIYVDISDVNLIIKTIDPWAKRAYVTSMGIAGDKPGFRYREAGQTEWIEVPESDITIDGGTFTAYIPDLRPVTRYEVLATCGAEETPSQEFTTTPATPLPNGGLEYTSLVAGADYYKFYDPGCGVSDGMNMFWGSGNGEGPEGVNGSANMGIVITVVDTKDKVEGKQSVCAQTSQMVGMLAAGNLFTGQFAGLVGTEGGKVNFGRPWNTRPVALRFQCKYTTDKMDIIRALPPGISLTKDDYDRAQIKFALGTWDYKKYGGTPSSPVHINTTEPKTFVDYATDKSTIAYGDLIIHNDGYILNGDAKVTSGTSEWVEFRIPLIYHDLSKTPTHIVISCAASQYGDYFTGCSSSKLWLDDFELIY